MKLKKCKKHIWSVGSPVYAGKNIKIKTNCDRCGKEIIVDFSTNDFNIIK